AAAVLLHAGRYGPAFGVLLLPAFLTLTLLVTARLTYPRPEDLEAHTADVDMSGLPRVFWVYLAGACLVAAGFADFSLAAYHFEKRPSFQRSGFRSSTPSRWVSAGSARLCSGASSIAPVFGFSSL